MVRPAAVCVVVVLVAAICSGSNRADGGATLKFAVFDSTGLPLGDVVDSKNRLLYVTENLGTIDVQSAASSAPQPFAAFAPGGEETRCVPSPTKPAYWPAGIYCHTPDNRIFRISPDGSSITQLATLPGSEPSDGGLTFDTVGRFGYALLAATGGSSYGGGQVFAIRESGKVQTIGSYPGPGGADEIALAPRTFGSAGGDLLIAIDEDGGHFGQLLAIDRHGTVQTVVGGLDSGLNPLALIGSPPVGSAANAQASAWPPAGLYLTDTNSENVFFAPSASFSAYVGDVFVGTEVSDEFWIVAPASTGFTAVPVTASGLPAMNPNYEGATYLAS